MVAWAEYKAQAKSRGALALELFVAHSTPAKAPEDVKAALPDHLAYQAELERAGSLAFAGPMSDETGQDMQGMGLIIYRADSLEAARALADGDPMHKTGARSYACAIDAPITMEFADAASGLATQAMRRHARGHADATRLPPATPSPRAGRMTGWRKLIVARLAAGQPHAA